jgi:hypothetical protein
MPRALIAQHHLQAVVEEGEEISNSLVSPGFISRNDILKDIYRLYTSAKARGCVVNDIVLYSKATQGFDRF